MFSNSPLSTLRYFNSWSKTSYPVDVFAVTYPKSIRAAQTTRNHFPFIVFNLSTFGMDEYIETS